ncbi:hypothetical protein GQ649_27705 [Rhodococcus sp. DSM 6344]|nr:hypothetical protein [Rhodococcus erythropolis]
MTRMTKILAVIAGFLIVPLVAITAFIVISERSSDTADCPTVESLGRDHAAATYVYSFYWTGNQTANLTYQGCDHALVGTEYSGRYEYVVFAPHIGGDWNLQATGATCYIQQWPSGKGWDLDDGKGNGEEPLDAATCSVDRGNLKLDDDASSGSTPLTASSTPPSSNDADIEANTRGGGIAFVDPSGTINCQVGGELAGSYGANNIQGSDIGAMCLIMTDYSGPAIRRPETCTRGPAWFPGAAGLGSDGTVNAGLCTGGQPFGLTGSTTAATIDDGQSVSIGKFGCTLLDAAVTCGNSTTGSGFTIARDRLESFHDR